VARRQGTGRELGAQTALTSQHLEDLDLKDTGHGIRAQITDRQAPSVPAYCRNLGSLIPEIGCPIALICAGIWSIPCFTCCTASGTPSGLCISTERMKSF